MARMASLKSSEYSRALFKSLIWFSESITANINRKPQQAKLGRSSAAAVQHRHSEAVCE